MPIIYSAVASSPIVKILRISRQDFVENVPSDVISKIEEKLWDKMKYLRERLMSIHDTKSEILKLDPATISLPNTVEHMVNMYPNSTKST